MCTLEGISSVANFINAYEVSIKPRLPFSICNMFFVSKKKSFIFSFNVNNCKVHTVTTGPGNKMIPHCLGPRKGKLLY